MKIGQKIFYSLHGAGVVKNIKKKSINEKLQNIYVIEIPLEQNLKILINEENLKDISYRNLLELENLEEVYDYLQKEDFPMSKIWSKRYDENMKRLKSINLYDIAYVLKGLYIRSYEKKLSIKELFMLNLARRLLISEFIMVSGFSKTKIDKIIDFSMKI